MLDNMQEVNQPRSDESTNFSINLNPREIADKNFDTRLRGFDRDQVNEFLDEIIKDYENYIQEVEHLTRENQRLIRRVDELSKQLTVAKQTGNMNKNSAVTNYDILKRISNLERKVFGLKLDNSE
ncbi:cell division regulator GpsB [Xylocopilactobacillus apicola]|uniref:Cell cycle protein GpsB n=1 Tax=Xylocopilactobacillus apicola TaxID=2932184 RepID=A0AAU9CX90_9LACO|nr:cell division regulator GpsB [Xylocopilactobacillus apicola]BDR58612.1 cell cycle protein GpsB [Xylocopilactobacillus apicola]